MKTTSVSALDLCAGVVLDSTGGTFFRQDTVSCADSDPHERIIGPAGADAAGIR